MSVLDAAMRRDRAVKVVLEADGQEEVVPILLPTGADCVDFVQDVAPVLVRLGDVLEVHGAKLTAEVVPLLVKWLPRLCPRLEAASEDEVTRALVNTGGTESPLARGFLRVMAAAVSLGAVKSEELLDFPFA